MLVSQQMRERKHGGTTTPQDLQFLNQGHQPTPARSEKRGAVSTERGQKFDVVLGHPLNEQQGK